MGLICSFQERISRDLTWDNLEMQTECEEMKHSAEYIIKERDQGHGRRKSSLVNWWNRTLNTKIKNAGNLRMSRELL